MEISESLLPYVSLPAAFLDPLDYVSAPPVKHTPSENNSREAWTHSVHNPANRPNSLANPDFSVWRVDGCSSKGRQYLLVRLPTQRNNFPTAIDLYIPDQTRHPPPLRALLGTSTASFTTPIKWKDLCSFICGALQYWESTVHVDFDLLLEAMPLGSCIVLENLSSTFQNMAFRLYPQMDYETRFLSLDSLKSMWVNDRINLPPVVRLKELNIKWRLTPHVSAIKHPRARSEILWVYKSKISNPRHLYHELRNLLLLQPHPNVLSQPAYLVTTNMYASNDERVCGFILEHYPLGHLGQAIERMRFQGVPDMRIQLDWAIQLTSTIEHILHTKVGFYSELRPENVVCGPGNLLVLIDFEQAGNWSTFTAPEVLYLENLRWLRESQHVPHSFKVRYQDILKRHLPNQAPPGNNYMSSDCGYFEEWKSMPIENREAAMVFSLGKVLWCIFECWGHTMNGVEEEFDTPCAWEFPECRRAPDTIRELIAACTKGKTWFSTPGASRLVRLREKIYPLGQTGHYGEPEASALETLLVAKRTMLRNLEVMEQYLEAKLRLENHEASDDDMEMLGFPRRPKLRDVLNVLQKELAKTTR